MPAKKRRKQSNPVDNLISHMAVLTRPEVIGLTLIVISVFTLLSLLTDSRGSLTGSWIDLWRSLTGSGVWGVPLLTGSLGLWMVIRVVEKMPDLPWQRPAGLFLLFLAYITGLTLWTPALERADMEAVGGLLGLWLAEGLSAGISVWGAWAVVTFLAITGLILLTDRLLVDLALDSWDALLALYDEQQTRRRDRAIDLQPALPMPSGELPLWKRLFSRDHTDEIDEPIINRSSGANRSMAAPPRQPPRHESSHPHPRLERIARVSPSRAPAKKRR